MATRRSACLVLIGLLAAAAPSASDQATDAAWTPGEKGEGRGYTYQVFSQQKEGEPFVRYRMRGTIDATPAELTRTARDVGRDPARAPDNETRKVLVATETETVMHTSVDLPMMFSDRDTVSRGVSSLDPKTGIGRIDFKSIDYPSVPPQKDFLRLTNTGGFWEFVPDGANRSRVTMETYIDLGGSLPGWLVSGMVASNLIGNYEDVAKEAVGK